MTKSKSTVKNNGILPRVVSLLLCLSLIMGFVPSGVLTVPVEAASVPSVSSVEDLADPVQVTGEFFDLSINTDKAKWNGPYFMVCQKGGTNYAISPLSPAPDGAIAAKVVTVSNNKIVNPDADDMISILYQSGNTFHFLTQDGYYLVRKDSGTDTSLIKSATADGIGCYTNGTAYTTLYRNQPSGSSNGNRNIYLMEINGQMAFRFSATISGSTDDRFYFYKATCPWSTQELYDAIEELLPYTANGGKEYMADVYEEFIQCLNDSVAAYQARNCGYDGQTNAQIIGIRGEIQSKAQELLSYKKILEDNPAPLVNFIDDVQAPVVGSNQLFDLTANTSGASWNGAYYMVAKKDGKSYAISPLSSAPYGTMAAKPVEISNNQVVGASLDDMIYVKYQTGNTCHFYTADGFYFEGRDRTLVKCGTSAKGIAMEVQTGVAKNCTKLYRVFSSAREYVAILEQNGKMVFSFPSNAGATDQQFYLYRVNRPWSTQELYDALQKMRIYAEAEGAFAEGIYKAFRDCVMKSIDLYNRYNVAATGSETYEQIMEIRRELEAQTQWLLSYENVLQPGYGEAAANIPAPYNELFQVQPTDFSEKGAAVFTSGTYYLVNMDTDGTGGRLLDLSGNFYDPESFTAQDVSISDDRVVDANIDWAIEVEKSTQSNWAKLHPRVGLDFALNGVTEDKKYFNLIYGERRDVACVSFPGGIAFVVHPFDVTGDGVNDHFYLTYVEDVERFRFALNIEKAESTLNVFQFYKLSTQSIQLYEAISEMQRYATGNKDNRYSETVYNQFITCLTESIQLYQQYNVALNMADEANLATITEKMNDKAEELLAYRTILTKADSLTEYIDIPVEFYDFRADGLLFEYLNQHYNLASVNPSSNLTPPGDWSDHGRINLTDKTLTNRKITYREEVVTFVVESMYDKNALSNVNEEGDAPGWNSAFYHMLPTVSGTPWEKGSYGKTMEKTQNGGELLWSNVSTYYDLAYYLLTYLWRPVNPGDIVDTENNLPYNVTVSQRDRLRCYADGTGVYTLDAAKEIIYDGYYIYNSTPTTETGREEFSPYFRPVDGLGFETSEMIQAIGGDTDRSSYFAENGDFDTEGANFHFSMHAYGSFVYYKNQNLYFEFVGDDDVYFFIDGKMALDIGGAHAALGGRINLNDIAASHGLVDGAIYDFDMFYAERHTTASNLKFSTNIRIVDTDTITTLGQYAAAPVDSVGRGQALEEDALVNVGDTVIYSYELRNTRDVPVYNISFENPTIGSTLTPDTITLYNPDLTNGAATNLTDLILFYTVVNDEGVESTATPQTVAYSTISSTLTEAVNNNKALTQNYKVTISSADHLRALLALGLPVNCKLSIYGFKRSTVEGDKPHTNTLSSLCYYTRQGNNEGSGVGEEFSVYGSASRKIHVASPLPKAEVQELVLDYGKAVQIPVERIRQEIYTEGLASVTGFVGLITSGTHGELLTQAPPQLRCTTAGDTLTGKTGTFLRTETGLEFELSDFMEEMETVFLVYALDGCEEVNGTNSSVEYHYMPVELRLIPATTMYYETDFAPNVFDLRSEEDFLFFDFTDKTVDRGRYGHDAYGDLNYDLPENWFGRNGTVGISEGNLVITQTQPSSAFAEIGGAGRAPLSFKVKESDYIQVRFRLENAASTVSDNTSRFVLFYNDQGGFNWNDFLYYDFATADVTDKGWVTISKPLKEMYVGGRSIFSLSKLVSITPGIHRIQNQTGETAKVYIDYLYIGPQETLPMEDYLYFGFTNTEVDRERYEDPIYGGQGFQYDVSNWATAATTGRTAYTMDNERGTVCVTVTNPDNDTGPYFAVTNTMGEYPWSGSPQYAPLNMPLKGNETVQIRFMTEDCMVRDNGTTDVQVLLHIDRQGAPKYLGAAGAYTLNNGKWNAVEIPLKDVVKEGDILKGLGFKFRYLGSAGNGQLIIDEAFLGQAQDYAKLAIYNRSGWVTKIDGTQSDKYQDTGELMDSRRDVGSTSPSQTASEKKKAPTKAPGAFTAPDGMTVTTTQNYTIDSTGVYETQLTVTTDAGPLAVYIATVEPNAKATVKVSNPGYYAPGSTPESREANAMELQLGLQRTTEQAAAYEQATGGSVLYATNGSFFDNVALPRGHLIMEGNVIQPGFEAVKEPFFAVLKDGTYAIREYFDPIYDVQEAIGARHMLVKDGVNVADQLEDTVSPTLITARHPRSAIGIKADGTLVSIIVDGREDNHSVGVDLYDMAEIMLAAGCVDAVNLDGGGSSTFASAHAGEQDLTIRNMVTDKDANGQRVERTVTSTLLVVSTAGQCQHTYAENKYSVNDDGTHNMLCDSCAEGVKEEHRFTNGVCVCGLADEVPNYLYFDFNYTELDKERYVDPAYGYFNFDTPTLHPLRRGFWATMATSINSVYDMEFDVDNDVGTLSVKVAQGKPYNDASNWGPWIRTTTAYRQRPLTDKDYSLPLHFDPSEAEVIQLRFKVEGCQCVKNADPRVVVVYDHTTGGQTKRGAYSMVESYSLKNGLYQTLTIDLNEEFKNADEIRSFGFRFWDLVSVAAEDTANRGRVVIDYIYVGPESRLPSGQNLLFDFGNKAEDRERYMDKSYGGLNFDKEDEGYWATYEGSSADKNSYTDYEIRNSAGTMTLQVANEMVVSNYGPWVLTTNLYGRLPDRSKPAEHALHYDPSEAEILQVRFKVDGCRSIATGGKTARVVLVYDYLKGSNSYRGDYGMEKTYTLENGVYTTVTIPLNDAFKGRETVSTVGLRFWDLISNGNGTVTIDYIYVGSIADRPVDRETVYGYDSSYEDDPYLSDGDSLYVEGAGFKAPNGGAVPRSTEVFFDFTGTGFDLISRTGKQQATIRVTVYSDEARTKLVKALTVNQKGELELYQIPTVSIQGLDHGRYYVTIGINKAINNSPFEVLNRGGEFYFDAIRIYDPVDTTLAENSIVLNKYRNDYEAYPYVKELRNILLDANSFAGLKETQEGAIFVDTSNQSETVDGVQIQVNDHITASVETYNKIGPKNEVYLDPGQAVAFKLIIDTEQIPSSLDIGAKSILGDQAQLSAGFVKTAGIDLEVSEIKLEKMIATATAMYYSMPLEEGVLTTGTDANGKVIRYTYLVIQNNGTSSQNVSSVLSITDVKAAYHHAPQTVLPEDGSTDTEIKSRGTTVEMIPVHFMVDAMTAKAAALYIGNASEVPVEGPETKIMHSLNLTSDISINYVIAKTDLGNATNLYLNCDVPQYEGNDLVGSKTVKLLPEERDNYYYFVLDGLTAIQMNDVIQAALYMTVDGKNFCVATDSYSIAQYAYSQLNKALVSDSLKTLCANLLRYGAKAQSFKNYRTDSLADADMTEVHKAHLYDVEAVTFGNTNKVLNDLGNAPISWAGKALDLESKVALKFVFNPANYKGDPSALTLKVSYTDINGTPKSLSIKDPELYNPDMGLYVFTLDALLAAELRTVVSVQIFAGDIPVSCTLQYSADTYGNNKTGNLLELCKALFAYSDSAKAYFQ